MDLETCSHCLVEVEYETLTYVESGEGLCPDCLEMKDESDALHADYMESLRD